MTTANTEVPAGLYTTVTVHPGQLVKVAGLGVQLVAGYREAQYGGQPYVTVNTEDLDDAHRYDDVTGMRGNATPYKFGQRAETANRPAEYIIEDHQGTVMANFDLNAGLDLVKMVTAQMNRDWASKCGIAAITVSLGDVDLYDDEGEGDIVHRPATPGTFVYSVTPPDQEPAVFEDHTDAMAFAETFDPPLEVDESLLATRKVAAQMIAERLAEVDPEDENGLSLTAAQRVAFDRAADHYLDTPTTMGKEA